MLGPWIHPRARVSSDALRPSVSGSFHCPGPAMTFHRVERYRWWLGSWSLDLRVRWIRLNITGLLQGVLHPYEEDCLFSWVSLLINFNFDHSHNSTTFPILLIPMRNGGDRSLNRSKLESQPKPKSSVQWNRERRKDPHGLCSRRRIRQCLAPGISSGVSFSPRGARLTGQSTFSQA